MLKFYAEWLLIKLHRCCLTRCWLGLAAARYDDICAKPYILLMACMPNVVITLQNINVQNISLYTC